MILYWVFVIGLCRCSFTESTWLYRSESSGDDGWSADDVFPGLYTTDKDGLPTLSIPPRELEMTLAYHPVESAQECHTSLLSDDVACYSACKGADFDLFPDEDYQVEWSDASLSKNTSRRTSVGIFQTVAQNPIDILEEIEIFLLADLANAALMPIATPLDVKQPGNYQSNQVSELCFTESSQDIRRPHNDSQRVETVSKLITGLQPKMLTPMPSMAQLLSFAPHLMTRPIPSQSKCTGNQSMSESLARRAVWFRDGVAKHFFFKSTLPDTNPLIAFSQHHIYGVTGSYSQATDLAGTNEAMGYRISHDRIMFLDGYKTNEELSQSQICNPYWLNCVMDRCSLGVESFKQMYPLEKDGLVVAIQESSYKKHQLLMASYGKPPLGAILLRPKGDWLVVVARTLGDTVESVNVQNGDVVVVGPLLGISIVELGFLLLGTSDTPDMIAKQVYGSTAEASLCVVATISTKR